VLDTGSVIDAEAEAMLQALHSRSAGGIKNHLQVLEEKGADNFMSKFYVGYGHKSIGDCGSVTVFIEGVSMLVAKAIQDNKLYSGQETSTRYVDFSQQKFIDPSHSEAGNSLLEEERSFYLSILPELQEHLEGNFPIEE
jgi:thymidylate synthase ThyX